MPDECNKLITSMKGKYKERYINQENQWPPCHSSKLVNLVLVERGKGEGYSANIQRGREDKGVKHTPLAYGDLFKVKSGKRPVRKVLVEGDAGIGKTTLCILISEDWANGKLFQQFELVLLLPLRMKAIASAGSLPELLKVLDPCFSQMLCDSVAKYFEGIEKKSVLIIADGWDELGESKQQEESFIYQLLFNSTISVVVTSRPSGSAPLHQLPCIDRFVEVHGFRKEHIVEYIQSEFGSDQEKAGHLLEQLEDNPLVESVCSVPLNCAIVCHLWRSREEALPTTMTELYTKIILNLVLRNIRKIDTYKSVLSLPKFDSLPADLQQSWRLLCEFAFHAIGKNQLVFSQEELEAFFPKSLALDKKILCFGLLQSAETIGCGVSFHFLHLTFQEFLAALHFVRLTSFQRLQAIRQQNIQSLPDFHRMAMVYRFFFGINTVDCSIQQSLDRAFGAAVILQDKFSLWHCAFEAQNDLINSEITDDLIRNRLAYLFGANKMDFGYPRTAHDCTAILYVIANLQECDGMKINLCNCNVRERQIIKLVDILGDKKGKLQITSLDLSYSRLTVSGLHALESAVGSDLLPKLEELNLAGSLNNDADTSAKLLTTFVEVLSAHCPNLERLNLSDNNLGTSAPVGHDLITKLIALKLKELDLRGTLTSDADTNAAWLTTLSEALLVHSPYLSRLDLSDNSFGVTEAKALSRLCNHSSNDDDYKCLLLLNRTNLGNKGLVVLMSNLKFISGLQVENNDINATGVLCLAYIVCSGKVVTTREFSFSGNPLGLEGTVVIGRMLGSSNCKLSELSLSRCELTTSRGGFLNTDPVSLGTTLSCEIVGQRLYQMSPNTTITVLFLNGNSFKGESIHILAGFMHLCPCLTDLYAKDCGITSDDLILLLDKLTQLKSSSPSLCELVLWHLGNNQIDDRGVSAIMDHLPSLFPFLWYDEDSHMYLCNNPVGYEMKKRLEELMKKREEVR